MGLTGPTQKTVETTNRASFYSDAVVDGTLLANLASKTIAPVDLSGNPLVAIEVLIINYSGQTASLNLHHAVSGIGRNPSAGFPIEQMVNPLRVLSGESFSIPGRIAQIVEENIGGAPQTGSGVRYIFIIQPDE
jgi:hypothetical protein